jgi:membrane protein DedA with SNARE-associated domain
LSLAQLLFNFIVHTMATVGYAGIFALMIVALAVSIPSEIILPFTGYLVYEGTFNFWLALLVATLGSIVGTMIDYAIGYYLGRAVVLRYGKYIHLSQSNLIESEKWFRKYGDLAVLLTRFVPLIRTLIAFPAGIGEMKVWKFLLYSTVGMAMWNAVLVYIGYRVGPDVQKIIDYISSTFTLVEIVAVMIALLALFLWMRRPKRESKDKEKLEPSPSTSN